MNGLSGAEDYTKDGDQPLSEAEVETLLKMNAGGRTWEPANAVAPTRRWVTEDDGLFALQAKLPKPSFSVASAAFVRKSAADKGTAAKKLLEGFQFTPTTPARVRR
jgi:hypothetical protein